MAAPRVRRSTRARPSDDDLLDAAREVFAQYGFRATTMQTVADRADCTKPTLYAHFGDKDALYDALLRREADTCRRWLFAAYETNADLELVAQVRADTLAFFDYATAEPDGFRLLMDDDPTRHPAEPLERLLADIEAQVGHRITTYARRHGVTTAFDVGQLAAILVAVPVSSARRALDAGADLRAAAHLAAQFSAAALRGLAEG